MTLPTSGPLSLSDIQTEFGGSNPIGLNEYYAGGSYVPAGTTGTYGAVPTSGQISIQNFYGTTAYYGLTKSLRFRSSASAYMNRTPASAGSGTTMTWSFWYKPSLAQSRAIFGCALSGSQVEAIGFDNGYGYGSNRLHFVSTQGSAYLNLLTTQLFRDPSAWYHIVVVFDSTQATASNRAKIYVNGSQVTAFDIATYPAQNYALAYWNNTYAQTISNIGPYYSAFNTDCYLADVYFIDGQALTPSSFGATNATSGTWQPAAYTGTYGTNGFHLTFTNTSSVAALGYDSSGRGNNWTPNNISLTAGSTYDSMTDVPTWTNTNTSNYAVLNPLNVTYTNCLSWGNLYWTQGNFGAQATIVPSSGKWYMEYTFSQKGSSTLFVGMSNDLTKQAFNGATQSWQLIYTSGGNIEVAGTQYTGYTSWTTGDVIGVAFDVDAGTATFYKNNTLIGSRTSASFAGRPIAFGLGAGGNEGTNIATANFGQQGFKYTPPTGYLAVNTYNIAAAAIAKGNQYMAATLYTGNDYAHNGTPQAISNGVFQPDFVWVKNRTEAYDNLLQDSVRGFGVSTILSSDQTSAPPSGSPNGYVSSATSTGFNVVGYTSSSGSWGGWTNLGGDNYVGWQWKGGGAAVTNNNGSLTSSVSANTTSGFSVVTWTSSASYPQTIGHGLGKAPSMIFVKNRQRSTDWAVYHSALGNTTAMLLNSSSGNVNDVGFWNNTSPTSTVFTTGNGRGYTTGGIAETYVAYCWAEIPGYSKFGSYAGNSSTDGVFLYCGFRPRYVIIKRYTTSGANWWIHDTSRDPYNVSTRGLAADGSSAETTNSYADMDILSNGIKLRTTSPESNGGYSYIYAAFAENPFNYSLAR